MKLRDCVSNMEFDGLTATIGDAKLLSAVVDTTAAMVAVTAPDGTLLKVNAAFERKLGFDSAQVCGRPIWDLRSYSEGENRTRFFREEATGDSYTTPEGRWRTAAGDEVVLRWTVQILRDDDGVEIAQVGTAEDLTEAHRESSVRRMLEHIADNLSEPLFFMNPDGVIAYASSAVRHVYGYEPSELMGRQSFVLRPADCYEKMADHFDQMQQSGRPRMIETEALRKDGSRVAVELRTSPVFDDNGTYLGVSAVVYDMSERKEMEKELRRLAGTDPLTGLANRLGFRTIADHEVKRAHRYGHQLSVFVTDIDHFKKVNDTYGHAAGDVALVRFSDLLGWSLRRPVDHVARTGGEEFVAILPETGATGGMAAAERVRASTEMNPITHEDRTFSITASFGVSIWEPEEEDLVDAVQRADEALYEAKGTGRNKVVFRDPDACERRSATG